MGDVNQTNLLTKFHEDWTIKVASRVLTRLYYSHVRKNAPPLFHDDRKINVTSRVLTGKMPRPSGAHVFQPTVIIFELVQDIIGMNLLTEKNAPPLGSHFHEDRKINVASRMLTRKNAPPPGGHVFQPTDIIFELVQDIIGMNLLIKFHEDLTINVVSRVVAPHRSSREKCPPLGSHVFQANVTIFQLIQDIIETNLLTKFHEDRTINVASRELTRQMLTAHDGRRTKGDHKSSP
ncbi:hypothetical protein DPMN_081088 [Dreissena polymorpha]|uniref:Uncharacterized protein n=1 Tax=Dreissena polymorpha TaxID=45954 RepID=A0A9D3Y8C7_DREPO|nr:hypothetical protein DPMN_081088 [Dreissena polymorpha]